MINILRTICILLLISISTNDVYGFDVDKDTLKYKLYKWQKVETLNMLGDTVVEDTKIQTGKTVRDIINIMSPYSTNKEVKIKLNGYTVQDRNKFNKVFSKLSKDAKYLYELSFTPKITNVDTIKLLDISEARVNFYLECSINEQMCSYTGRLDVPLLSSAEKDLKPYKDEVLAIGSDVYFNNVLKNNVTNNDIITFYYLGADDCRRIGSDNYVDVLTKFKRIFPNIRMTGAFGQINSNSDISKVAIRRRDACRNDDKSVQNEFSEMEDLISKAKYKEALEMCIKITPEDNPDNCIYSRKKAGILMILDRSNEAFDIYNKNINRVCEDKNSYLWQEYIKEDLKQYSDILSKYKDKHIFNSLYDSYLNTLLNKKNNPIW